MGARRVHDHATVPVLAVDDAASGGLASDFNYVRNSVKATVDAYDGTVKFYVFDPKDPIIQVVPRRRSPTCSPTARKMPTALRAHLRYPEDLFKVQSDMFGRYHVTEPAALLRRQREVAGRRPTRARAGRRRTDCGALIDRRRSTTRRATQPQAATSTGERIDPYYLYIKLAGRADPSTSSSSTPFVPVSSGNSADAPGVVPDRRTPIPAHYGELRAFTMPQGADRPGPGPGRTTRSTAPTAISTADHAAEPAGLARSIQGSLQLIPVGNSIALHPAVLRRRAAASGSYPQFRFVVVVHPGLRRGLRADGATTASTSCSASADAHHLQRRRRASGPAARGDRRPARPRRPRRPPRAPGTSTTTAPPASTTHPAATGDAQDLLNQAAATYRRRPDRRSARPGDLARLPAARRRRPRHGEAGPAGSRSARPAAADGSRDCSGSRGLLLSA